MQQPLLPCCFISEDGADSFGGAGRRLPMFGALSVHGTFGALASARADAVFLVPNQLTHREKHDQREREQRQDRDPIALQKLYHDDPSFYA